MNAFSLNYVPAFELTKRERAAAKVGRLTSRRLQEKLDTYGPTTVPSKVQEQAAADKNARIRVAQV